ncbi:hypothetical protein VP1G_00687 [Cytospora mali]|uniref:Uncharacterized protein n=1 Tax=Cytospora mali TaxID=578113 RepID=A0A194UNK2_CYTMA|nr:hypothetical protein VP1G_00687 [Valsa mali var. pyri (nom. inval.)]
MNAIRVSALRSGARSAHPTANRATLARRGYATDNIRMDTANKPSRLPILIGGAALLIVGGLYVIRGGQKDIAHNDHAAQAGGVYTQGRQSRVSAGGIDQSKSDLPADAPNKPENLAASQEKMQNKAPSKKTNPLK